MDTSSCIFIVIGIAVALTPQRHAVPLPFYRLGDVFNLWQARSV